MGPPSLRHALDPETQRQAKTLLRTERHGALASLDPAEAGPAVSRVAVATAPDGAPIILISRLAAHFAALEADPRCALLLGAPGKGDPLAHPRLSLAADARRLDGAASVAARGRFLARHPKAALYADFADFAFWRLEPRAVDFYAGFAKAYALTAEDLRTPTDPDLAALEPEAVAHMNTDHADAVRLYAERLLDQPAGDWRLAGVDREGLDLVDGDRVARLWFDPPLRTAGELRARLVVLAKRARDAEPASNR